MKLNWNVVYDFCHTYISSSVSLPTLIDKQQVIYQCNQAAKEFAPADLVYFVIIAIASMAAVFAGMHAYQMLKSRQLPKYRYDFGYDKATNSLVLTLKLRRSEEIPYYVEQIELGSSKKPILSYEIDGHFYNQYDMQIKKNKVVDIHHLVQPVSNEYKDTEIEFKINISLPVKERTHLRVFFGYDKYPFGGFISIKLPPKNHTVT